MWLAVFGATGRTGRLLVAQALDEGHRVTAFVRSPDRLPIIHPELTKVRLHDPDSHALDADLKGADAVVSVLNGSVRGGYPATAWTRAALSAMAECDIRRLVFTSAAPVALRLTRGADHSTSSWRHLSDSERTTRDASLAPPPASRTDARGHLRLW